MAAVDLQFSIVSQILASAAFQISRIGEASDRDGLDSIIFEWSFVPELITFLRLILLVRRLSPASVTYSRRRSLATI